ncbi:MAG: amino acid permease [Propionibacteriaceae bacterium]
MTDAALPPSGSAPAATNIEQEAGLSRRLTSGQIAMIGLSGALGTGLFLGSGSMIATAGPAIVVSYALTGLVCLAVVFAMAEVTTQHPVHGGFGASASAYGGPFFGYLARWNVAITMTLAVGVEVVASAKYLQFWWPNLPLWVGVAIFSAMIVAVNLAAVSLYGVTEYWFSLLKVIVVCLFIAFGLVLILFGLPGHAAEGFGNLTEHGGFAPHGMGGILAAAVAAIFSFGGAENVSLAAAESLTPKRDIPRAARSMIVRLLVFYIGAIFIVVAVQPWTVAAASNGDIKSSPFVSVLAATGIPGIADFMNFILIVAALSAGNGCLYASTRMIHSLSVDDMAPKALAATAANGAPRRAVLAACSGMLVACIMSLTLPSKTFSYFFGIMLMGLLLTWVYILITHLFFRAKRAHLGLPASPVQLLGGRVSSWSALIALLAAAIYLAFDPAYQIAWTVGVPVLLAVAACYYFVPRSVKKSITEHNVLSEELEARP